MRKIHLNGLTVTLSDEAADKHQAIGTLYACGDIGTGHDLHLSPDHEFSDDDVEALIRDIMASQPDAPAWERLNAKAVAFGSPVNFGPHMTPIEALDEAMAVVLSAFISPFAAPAKPVEPAVISYHKINEALMEAATIADPGDRLAFLTAVMRYWQRRLSA